jgi:hypothetical protein
MKSLWFGALACLLSAPVAHAQLAVYGEGQAVRLNDQASATTTWFKGGTFGLYDDFLRLPLLGFGFDARGTFASNGNQHFRSGMVGLRADARAPVLPFRPYVEGLIGVGGTRTDVASNLASNYSNKFEYEVLGGMDFTVFPHVDLRLPEIGYAQMSPVSSVANPPSAKLLELSAGLVIRLF